MIRFLLLLFLSGCSGHVIHITDYPPIEKIEEIHSPWMEDHHIFTIGTSIFTDDLPEIARLQREEPLEFRALMLHEQVHARRQLGQLATWLAFYIFKPGFSWEEEKLAWEVELRFKQQHGILKSPEYYARCLADYPLMVSYEEALLWVKSIIGDDDD